MKQKSNKILFSSLMACLLMVAFLSSCKKDKAADPAAVSTPAETTVKQDQDNMLATSDAFADDIVNVTNTQAAKAGTSLISFTNKGSVFGKKGDINDQVGEKLRILMYNTKDVMHINKRNSSAKTTGTTPFDFKSKTGTYSWNPTKKGWDSISNITGNIVIMFPSDTNKTSVNNAILTISSYSEQMIVDSTGNRYMPTNLVANLTVNGEEFAKLNYTGTFNNKGIPVTINLNLFVKPYTLTVLLNNQTTTVTADVKLTNAGQTIIGINGTMVFVDATQKDIKTVDATVQLKQLSITGNINVAAVKAVQNPKASDLNNNIKVAISYSGTKAGDIVFVDNATSASTDAVIKFKDGTTKPAMEFFTTVTDKISKSLKDAKFAKK